MNKPWVTALIVMTLGLTACVTSKPEFETDNEAAAAYNLQLGVDYFKQGRLAQAKEKLDRSLQQNPKNAQTYVAAGLLYDRINEGRKADQLFARAVDLDPKNAEIMNSYAAFLCRRGDHAKGEQLAVQAASNLLYKTPEVGWLNAGYCAQDAKRDAKAEEYFRRALAIKPNFSQALLQMAELEFNGGNLLPSRAFLERFLQSSKPTAGSLWLAVRLEQASGNPDVAERYAQRLKQEFPTSVEVKALLEAEKKKS